MTFYISINVVQYAITKIFNYNNHTKESLLVLSQLKFTY
jgi:hypothetical protein